MPDTVALEDQLRTLQDLYATICREADADQVRDDAERATIARVGEKLDLLRARVRAQRAGPDGAPSAAQAAWQDLSEDVALFRDLCAAARVQDGLRDQGFAPAATLARHLAAMEAAEKAQDWQAALDQYRAGKAHADAQDLWAELGVDPAEDDEPPLADPDDNPARTRWDNWQFLHDKLHTLSADLAAREHPLADRLGAYLDEIAEAAEKGEYQRATDLLVNDAAGLANDADLWNAVESGEDNLLPAITQDQIARLNDLSRELNRMDHAQAAAFDDLVAAIPKKVTEFARLIPAGRATERAWTFADRHALWDAVPPLPKNEEERIFWQTDGSRYRRLCNLQRDLARADRPEAAPLGEKIAAVDAALGQDQFYLAGLLVEDAQIMADDGDLWHILPESPTETGGDTPATESLGGSVGRGGRNEPADVVTVQRLLNRNGAALAEDGACGPKTIAAIEAFQKRAFGKGDGRVDPDGRTLAALTGKVTVADLAEAASDAGRQVSRAVTDAVGTVADTLGDAIDGAGAFLDDLIGGKP